MKGISQNGKIISLSLCIILLFSIASFSVTPLETTGTKILYPYAESSERNSFNNNLKSNNVKIIETSIDDNSKIIKLYLHEEIEIFSNEISDEQLHFVKQNMERKAILEKIFFQSNMRTELNKHIFDLIVPNVYAESDVSKNNDSFLLISDKLIDYDFIDYNIDYSILSIDSLLLQNNLSINSQSTLL